MGETWLHWFRRDLRVHDNTGLSAAVRRATSNGCVGGVFVIDPRWWRAERGKLGAFQARFWLESLKTLWESLAALNIPLAVRVSDDPAGEVLKAARNLRAKGVTLNKEYEPAQIAGDERLEREAQAAGIEVMSCKDGCIFEEEEVLTEKGTPFTVFTPYKRAWLKRLAAEPKAAEPAGGPVRLRVRPRAGLLRTEWIPTLEALGFENVSLDVMAGEAAATQFLQRFVAKGLHRYAITRDFPALGLPGKSSSPRIGTSRLSAHLSAGTISVRQVMDAARKGAGRWRASADVFVRELIWREFYRMVLFFHPHTVSEAFQEKYRAVKWKNDPRYIEAWRTGRTGYPIVDAGMRQLLTTGFMHNRLRMIVAMFLTKDLDVHWTIGERFFRRTLMDYDQASNVGGWQWSASTGTDAAPYFRVMNPVRQSERWDGEGEFIRHFLPELRRVPAAYIHKPWEMPADLQRRANCVVGRDYPAPIVDHAAAKADAIAKFRVKGNAASV